MRDYQGRWTTSLAQWCTTFLARPHLPISRTLRGQKIETAQLMSRHLDAILNKAQYSASGLGLMKTLYNSGVLPEKSFGMLDLKRVSTDFWHICMNVRLL